MLVVKTDNTASRKYAEGRATLRLMKIDSQICIPSTEAHSIGIIIASGLIMNISGLGLFMGCIKPAFNATKSRTSYESCCQIDA
jgi:hypothetical protein